MDPYSAEGELVNVHNAFHQGQYQQVVDFDTGSFSASNALPVRVLKLRARLALGQYDAVAAEAAAEPGVPDLQAAGALAAYLQSGDDKAVATAQKLAAEQGDNLSVQLLAGSVLANAGLTEEALALLAKHQGSLDAVALIVQIHLQQNRADLAAKEAQQARKWAQDSLLVNIAESWVGLREGGEKYQQAFYVFEELAQAPASQAVQSLVGQAISELHLGRYPEAEAALQQAIGLDPKSADVLANTIVLNTILGKDTTELKKTLQEVDPKHPFLAEVTAKKDAFDAAQAKYTPKFEA
ncbi:putative coatomer subunit epsilon protein [Neofusicoccum parvum UCRNP2]|uniref:Coatomer subunit epsilon n=1 Tax=Botryosphaeria parva (strain UCR-NP2) TaxID=1287680 RepID=R1FW09_BOTPV|nr:putative coatomer subunit epsilon protein [Neofusicoccum parvum UCRNP2]